MKEGQYFQQGDVLLKCIAKLPDGLVRVDDKTLQHGETTGHRHRFLDDANVEVYFTNSEEDRERITPFQQKFVIVKDQAILFHEEHKPITVEPGLYAIDIVREYDYEKDEVTRVVD